MIAKPLPATSTTTPMTINNGAFMCDLGYLRSPRRGAPPFATRGPDVLQSQQKRKHSVRQVPQWLEMCLQLLPE